MAKATPEATADKTKKATKPMNAKKDTLTFTQSELANMISEQLFFGLAGTPDARPWEQCDYEGDLVADLIWSDLVRNR